MDLSSYTKFGDSENIIKVTISDGSAEKSPHYSL